MGRPSKIRRLPVEVQKEIDRALIASGFTGYEALGQSLKGQGYRLSKSTLHRHGLRMEARLEAARAAGLSSDGTPVIVLDRQSGAFHLVVTNKTAEEVVDWLGKIETGVIG